MSRPTLDPLEVGRGGVLRDQYDRALLLPPEGGARRPYTSMSTLAKQLGQDASLHRWELRNVAKGVGMSRELSALAGSSRYDTRIGEEDEARNREEGLILDEIVRDAKELAGAHQKRNWGSAFHRYAEMEDPLGEPPLDMVPDLEAFRSTLKRLGIKILDTEVFVVNELLGAAGSFDYLLSVPWIDNLVIGDSKTGVLKLDQDEIQLWGYAGSVVYDRDTDERITFAEKYGMEVDQEVGYTVHTPAMSGETKLYPLDLVSGKESAELAKLVHARNSRVQKYYRKVKPIDVEAIQAERVEEQLQRLEGAPYRFLELQARLKDLHRENKEIWTADWTQRGGKLLREQKAREAA